MPDVGGPERWPDWCMGYQPVSTASQPRLRLTFDLRFHADEFIRLSMTPDLQVWRDNRGRWSVSPKED